MSYPPHLVVLSERASTRMTVVFAGRESYYAALAGDRSGSGKCGPFGIKEHGGIWGGGRRSVRRMFR
jgi:hypothetical protein